jgi:hypothetical protein
MCEERSVLAADAVQSSNTILALDASSRSSHFGPYSEAGLPGSMSVSPESTELEHPPKANTIANVENAVCTFMVPSLRRSATLHT